MSVPIQKLFEISIGREGTYFFLGEPEWNSMILFELLILYLTVFLTLRYHCEGGGPVDITEYMTLWLENRPLSRFLDFRER